MLKNDRAATNVSGNNEQYEGFIKDLLDEIMRGLDVDYNLTIRRYYGHKQGQRWVGTIGDVVNKVGIQSTVDRMAG